MFEFDHDCLKANNYFKKLLALRITHLLIKNNIPGKEQEPMTAVQIAEVLGLPIRLGRQLLLELVESGIIAEMKDESQKEAVYQPGQSPDLLSIQYVGNALERRGVETIPVHRNRESVVIEQSLQAFEDKIKTSSENFLLKNI
jgi:membrane protein